MPLDLHIPVTQEAFANLVGVSQQAISELVTRETLPRNATLKQWLHAYCENLREQAAGRAASGDLALVAERAKLARSQRERIDMENARRRGEVAPIAKLRDALEDAIAAMVDALDGLPGAIKRRVPALTTEDLAFIADEISRMRDNLADTNIDEEPDDDEGDAPENSSPSEAGS